MDCIFSITVLMQLLQEEKNKILLIIQRRRINRRRRRRRVILVCRIDGLKTFRSFMQSLMVYLRDNGNEVYSTPLFKILYPYNLQLFAVYNAYINRWLNAHAIAGIEVKYHRILWNCPWRHNH